MARTSAPKDADGVALQALRPLLTAGSHQIIVTSTTARNSIAFGSASSALSLWALQDMFVRFGDSTVTATTSDHFIPKEMWLTFSLGGDLLTAATHIAAIRDITDGTLHISEQE